MIAVLLNPDDAIHPPPIQNLRPSDSTCLSRGRTRADIALFNESQSRIVITVSPENAAKAEHFLKSKSVPHPRLGSVTADQKLTITAAGKPFTWPLEKLRTPFEKTIPSLMSWEK